MFRHKNVNTAVFPKEHQYGLICEVCGQHLGSHFVDGWRCPVEETTEMLRQHGDTVLKDINLRDDSAQKKEAIKGYEARVGALVADSKAAGLKDTNPKDAIGSKKAPMSTLPAGVLAEMGVAMLEGAAKYGKFNYRIVGVRASVYYDALMRHMMAWYAGEDTDPDSSMPHIVKALTTLLVLRDAQCNGMLTDDRPPISPINYAELNAKSAAIIEMHKDKAPRHYTREDKIGGGK